ncbi:hypothetical protein AXK11_06125 [Cephaloticoccus primus]|uniref:Uncharacterized protein n=1 Tax=Cephaloticoccus primus TaxID=1548207 RepID=A0A139SLY4_9BACT|nr:hypothetical protein AXK11_06125 [Cephaloticoccus primus]
MGSPLAARHKKGAHQQVAHQKKEYEDTAQRGCAQKKSRRLHCAWGGGGAPQAIQFAILLVRYAPEQNRKFNGAFPQSRCDWERGIKCG